MSRHLGIYSQGVPDLVILNSEKSLESKSWVTRDSHGNVTERVDDTAKSWTTTKDLSRYKKVHFQVTGGAGSRSIYAGSVSKSNPGTGEQVLDISGISSRSSLEIKLYVNAAPASAAGYYPSTNVTTYSIKVSKIWATAN